MALVLLSFEVVMQRPLKTDVGKVKLQKWSYFLLRQAGYKNARKLQEVKAGTG